MTKDNQDIGLSGVALGLLGITRGVTRDKSGGYSGITRGYSCANHMLVSTLSRVSALAQTGGVAEGGEFSRVVLVAYQDSFIETIPPPPNTNTVGWYKQALGHWQKDSSSTRLDRIAPPKKGIFAHTNWWCF